MFDEDMKSEFWQNSLLQMDYMGLWNNEKRDDSYLWEMYPQESKILRSLAQEALDLEDYRGSFIYDEYPDKFLFLRMSDRIARHYEEDYVKRNKNANQTPDATMMFDATMKKWIREMSQVILANEIERRRRRRTFW
ncbi:MAG: hypothetical protein ACI4AQ_07275 [Lachnospiraceae bacterium]